MARRRSSRRSSFGSSEIRHRNDAKTAIKAMRFWAKEFRYAVKQRSCSNALHALTTANRQAAVATTSVRGMGHGAKHPMHVLNHMEQAFKRACVR